MEKDAQKYIPTCTKVIIFGVFSDIKMHLFSEQMYVFLLSKIVLKPSGQRGCGFSPANVGRHACRGVTWGRGYRWGTENAES